MPRAPFGFDAAAHERHHWWRSLVFKVLPAALVWWLVWWWIGGVLGFMVGLAIVFRYLGLAIAPDVIALGGTTWRTMRGAAYRQVQGRFYQFKGHRIRVEDDELLPQRWLAVADLATALGQPLPLPVLRRRWPEGLHEQADGIYVLDDVALAWLGEQRDARAGRLRHWVERDVWYPARGLRASYAGKDRKGAPAGAPLQD